MAIDSSHSPLLFYVNSSWSLIMSPEVPPAVLLCYYNNLEITSPINIPHPMELPQLVKTINL